MPKYRTRDIRNVALVGHAGSGKTTLAEALLVESGTKGEAGTIERGSTTMDHDPLERTYLHSLDSSLASLDHEGMHLNLIDTAGIPDLDLVGHGRSAHGIGVLLELLAGDHGESGEDPQPLGDGVGQSALNL